MRNWLVVFGLLAAAMTANTPAAAQQKPNVVFILTDNLQQVMQMVEVSLTRSAP